MSLNGNRYNDIGRSPFRNAWATDSITCISEVTLSWMDRVRVLLRGELTVRAVIECEVGPGKTAARSRTEIPRIFPRRDDGRGAECAPSKDDKL